MDSAFCVRVQNSTDAAEARRTAMQLASRLAFDETDAGNVGLVVTEAAKNLLKHAGGGELLIQAVQQNGCVGVEMLAIDKGRGIENIGRSFEDGYSTSGTPGTGLGAISRLSTLHDIYSQPNQGTALLAQIWSKSNPQVHSAAKFQVGVVSAPKAGEPVCGDSWGFVELAGGVGRLTVADGLGHGILAADASRAAVRIGGDRVAESGPRLIERIHEALRPTRGAAVAVAEIDGSRGVVRYVGIGNIGGSIVSASGAVQHMVSHAGTAGHELHRIVEFEYPWNPRSLLILHSDGLASHWSLERYPGLTHRQPGLIAGVLYRDFNRVRDDATVVVVRESGGAA